MFIFYLFMVNIFIYYLYVHSFYMYCMFYIYTLRICIQFVCRSYFRVVLYCVGSIMLWEIGSESNQGCTSRVRPYLGPTPGDLWKAVRGPILDIPFCLCSLLVSYQLSFTNPLTYMSRVSCICQ